MFAKVQAKSSFLLQNKHSHGCLNTCSKLIAPKAWQTSSSPYNQFKWNTKLTTKVALRRIDGAHMNNSKSSERIVQFFNGD